MAITLAAPRRRGTAHPFTARPGQTIGRCQSCRRDGRALSTLVDWTDDTRFEVCDDCAPA